MPSVYLDVKGARSLAATLRKAENTGLLAALKVANASAAEVVVDEALPNVPMRTGALRASTRALASAQSGRAVVGGTQAVPYGAAIHWGRKSGNVGSPPGNRRGRNPVAGRPFLWNAAQSAIPRIEPEYRDEIMRIMEIAMQAGGVGSE